jgi:hypothetical protein
MNIYVGMTSQITPSAGYVLTPSLYLPLRTLATVTTDNAVFPQFAFCLHLFTFNLRKLFSSSSSRLSLLFPDFLYLLAYIEE